MLIIAVAFVVLFSSLMSANKNLDAIETIDINMVQDGTYTGSTDAVLVKVDVEVTVKDHKIVAINLIKHQNGQGKPAETVLDTMLANNVTEVDAVSGATMSSKALVKAVNVALAKGVK